MDTVGPALAAGVFVLIMRKVRDPFRRDLNAVAVAGVCGAYISGGGFGVWELAYPLVATPVVLRALRSYRFIAIGWWMHAAWDVAHHLWGNPIWSFMPTSSCGCVVFDSLIAIWLWRQESTFPLPLRGEGQGEGKPKQQTSRATEGAA